MPTTRRARLCSRWVLAGRTLPPRLGVDQRVAQRDFLVRIFTHLCANVEAGGALLHLGGAICWHQTCGGLRMWDSARSCRNSFCRSKGGRDGVGHRALANRMEASCWRLGSACEGLVLLKSNIDQGLLADGERSTQISDSPWLGAHDDRLIKADARALLSGYLRRTHDYLRRMVGANATLAGAWERSYMARSRRGQRAHSLALQSSANCPARRLRANASNAWLRPVVQRNSRLAYHGELGRCRWNTGLDFCVSPFQGVSNVP